ncbi:MAG TPA: hypothetical protein GXZ31_07930 [Thermoanaerobacterales bacterium]|nr:hypothetical protein [Thermoanaerobacterales bacterium]
MVLYILLPQDDHAGYKGFRICQKCGYAVVHDRNVDFTHKTAFGNKCSGPWERVALGFEFHTDILQIRFEGYKELVIQWKLKDLILNC